jgi:hypothetical protein
MARKAIPKKIKHKIMYDSRYVCVACQQRGSHIHHIDEDNANNQEENLTLLCTTHHDEAHTKHQLSQNLSQVALRDAKQKWVSEVKKKRELISTVSGQLSIVRNNLRSSISISWGYINHKRVAQLSKPELLIPDDKRYFKYCIEREIIDKKGILIKPTNALSSSIYVHNSVYDWYEHGDDQRLHYIYTAFVDQISRSVQPIHLETKSLTKSRILELVTPGDFVFLDRPFEFRCIEETQENQHGFGV